MTKLTDQQVASALDRIDAILRQRAKGEIDPRTAFAKIIALLWDSL